MPRKHNVPRSPITKSVTELRQQGRLARIAAALASGATVTEVAKAEDISREMASRVANSAECRQLIADFVNHEHELMCGLFYRALAVIEDAFSAKREYTNKEGEVFHGGPDHYARLAATRHRRDFLTAGRPRMKAADDQSHRGLTYEELEAAALAERSL